MPTDNYVLVLNSGSSSLKFALYTKEDQKCLGSGVVSAIGLKPSVKVKGAFFKDDNRPELIVGESCRTVGDAVSLLLLWMGEFLPQGSLKAVGHRVVHGGDMTEHTAITPALITYLKTTRPLAPLHQPYNIAGIEQIAISHPHVPQVACFDTAFHSTVPDLHKRFAIPSRWFEKGVRRYGFHGLSYEYIAEHLKEISPKAFNGRTIVAHLGNGASLCALKGGESFDTTMGFSALEGLVMGTRPGIIDPGVLLYLMREAKYDLDSLEKFLYKECGLLGLSGVSSDMAVLLSSDEPTARQAIDVFCHRIVREVGALASVMGGLDALVFTGGIGENAVAVREQVVEGLKWLGIKFDSEKNKAAAKMDDCQISALDSEIEVWKIPTDEEGVIVAHTCSLVFK